MKPSMNGCGNLIVPYSPFLAKILFTSYSKTRSSWSQHNKPNKPRLSFNVEYGTMRFRHPFIDGFMPYKPPPWIPPPWSILHYRTVLILLIAFVQFTTTIPIVNDPRRIFHSNIINRHANITTTTTSFPTTFTTSTTLSLTTIRGDTTSSFHYDGFHSILNTRHTNYFITNRHLIFTTTTLPISNTPHIISTTSPIGDTIIFSYPSFGTTILPLNIQQQDKTNGNIIISTTIIDTHPIYNTNTPFISSSSLTLTDHFLITTKFSNTNSHINYEF